MPIHPGKNETQSEWMARCVPEMMGDGKRPNEQAVAACLQMWRDRDKDADDVIVRAWAPLEIKRLPGDEELMEIYGMASTPSTDRMGDVVEPLGLSFTNPLPLLWQHRHGEPIGLATLDSPSDRGVTFTARLAKIIEPGALKERVADAWQAIKAGLVRGVSIGFKSLEHSIMKDGGVRFLRGEVVELSLVTVPANSQATITAIKNFDAASALAPEPKTDARKLPGAAGKETPTRKAKTMPTTAEQISAYEARRTTATEAMKALMAKATDEGRTLSEAETSEYDGYEAEAQNINETLTRLKRLEAFQRNDAIQVSGKSIDEAATSRDGRTSTATYPRVVMVNQKMPPATMFVRYAMAMVVANGDVAKAEQYARRRQDWLNTTPDIVRLFENDAAYYMRAAQPAGTTYDSTWAGALVYAQNATSEFAEFLRPLTIIGRIPGLRRVPFNIRVPRATSGTSAAWVGEAAPKPVTAMAFDTITMTWAKIAAIVVITEELARFSNPAAEDVVRADLARAIVQYMDRQFVDPSFAAVTNVSPAAITNSITPITATGTNMAAFRADIKSLFASILDDNQSISSGAWIMTQQQALALSLAQNSLGQTIYPTIDPIQGGTLLGYPVIASENIPATGGSPTDGYPLIFVVANEILLADDGQVTVDASREASVQMDTAPDSPPTASSNMISLWQLNQIGLKAERFVNWARRRSTAVAWIQNAKYAE